MRLIGLAVVLALSLTLAPLCAVQGQQADKVYTPGGVAELTNEQSGRVR
jgi:hypothetical protein